MTASFRPSFGVNGDMEWTSKSGPFSPLISYPSGRSIWRGGASLPLIRSRTHALGSQPCEGLRTTPARSYQSDKPPECFPKRRDAKEIKSDLLALCVIARLGLDSLYEFLRKDKRMATKQGDTALLNDPVAKELLQSTI